MPTIEDQRLVSLFCGKDKSYAALSMVSLSLDEAYYHYRNNPASHECPVSNIQLCKEKEAPYHEFVILEVLYPSTSKPSGYVYVDRTTPREGLPASHVAAMLNYTPSKSTAFISQLSSDAPGWSSERSGIPEPSSFSSSQSVTFPSSDRVIILDKVDSGRKRQYDVIFSLDIRAESIFLHTVLAAASAVHRYRPDYSLLRAQCYWYALVFCRLLIGESRWPEKAIAKRRAGYLKGGKGRGDWEIVTPDMVRRAAEAIQPSFREEAELIRNLKSDAEMEEAIREAQAERQRAHEKRRAAEQRAEEEIRRRQHAEASAAAKDETIAQLTQALLEASSGARVEPIARLAQLLGEIGVYPAASPPLATIQVGTYRYFDVCPC